MVSVTIVRRLVIMLHIAQSLHRQVTEEIKAKMRLLPDRRMSQERSYVQVE